MKADGSTGKKRPQRRDESDEQPKHASNSFLSLSDTAFAGPQVNFLKVLL
jgi:hypothetical protein